MATLLWLLFRCFLFWKMIIVLCTRRVQPLMMTGHFLAAEVEDRGRRVFCRLAHSKEEYQSKGQSSAEHRLFHKKQRETLDGIVTITAEVDSSSLHTLESRYLCLEVESFGSVSRNPRYRNCVSELQQRAFWNDDRLAEPVFDMSDVDRDVEERRIRSENRKLKTEVRGMAAENRVLKDRLGRLVQFEFMFPRCYFGAIGEVVPVGCNPAVAAGVASEVVPVGSNLSVDNVASKPQEEKNEDRSEYIQMSAIAGVTVTTSKSHVDRKVAPAGYNPAVDDEVEVVEIADSSDDDGDAPEIVNGVDRSRSASGRKRKRRD